MARIQGIVMDKDRVPIEGAFVELNGFSDLTDSFGFFSIANVETGVFTLKVSMTGFSDFVNELEITDSNADIFIPIILGQPTEGEGPNILALFLIASGITMIVLGLRKK